MIDFLRAAREFERQVVGHIDARPFTGLRCDHPGCPSALCGVTETRDQLHALTRRAESFGWQCVHHDGQAMHFCPEHVDPDRQRLRRLYR